MRPPSGFWKTLAAWYRANGRDLPWRRTADPYAIVVSEFMLQQTQVDRVVPLHRAFLSAFPSWQALAKAPQADVVRAWKGLGYNMRAVRLKKLAEEVILRHDGRLPDDQDALLALKGIGPYTARALRVFVFRRRVLAPDTNIRRVLTRAFLGATADPKAFDEKTWGRWEVSLPPRLSYDVNQALMDVGATICKAAKPACPVCPLHALCKSYPRILKLRTLPRQKSARRERVDAHGLPDRIYRGRIIEALRKKSWMLKDLPALGRAVKPSFKGAADAIWLEMLLSRLERDGLIARKGGKLRLA